MNKGTMKTISEEKKPHKGWKITKHLRPRIKDNSFHGVTFDTVWTGFVDDDFFSASTLRDLKEKIDIAQLRGEREHESKEV